MANPITGVYLNELYYNYIENSYSRTLPLKNSVITTQTTVSPHVLGAGQLTHTLTLLLDSTYTVYSAANNNIAGNTTFVGLSRLTQFTSYIGALGTSMPLTFVAPDGTSHRVIPVGDPNISFFLPEAQTNGYEYRVQLTLANVS